MFNVVQDLYAAGQFAEMQTAAEQAVRHYERVGAPVLQARTLHRMSDASRLTGDLDGATDHLRNAERLAHLHRSDDPETWQGVLAATERRMAAVRWSQGRLDEARALLDGALQRVSAAPVPDPSERAAIYTTLGAVQKSRGEYSRAVTAYEKALETYANVPNPSPLEVATAYNNAGDLHAELGDTHRALRYYRQALTVYDSGDRHPLVGTLYNNIATAHALRGEYEASLEASARALQLFRATLGDQHPKVGWVLGMRASSLLRTNRPAEAMAAYRACVQIYRAAFGDEHPYTASGLVGLGWGWMQQGQHDAALEALEDALSIRRALHGDRHPELARVHHVFSDLYVRQGRYDDALDALDDALQANRLPGPTDLNLLPIPPPSTSPLSASPLSASQTSASQTSASTSTALSTPSVYAAWRPASGREVATEAAFARTATIVRGGTFASDIMLLGTIWRRGNVFQARAGANTHPGAPRDVAESPEPSMGDLEAALASYRLGLDVVDRMRRSYRNEASKLELTAQTRQLLERAVHVAYRMYRTSNAPEHLDALFRLSEQGRATVLRDAIAESNARQFAGVPDTLLQKERRLREDLATHEQRLRQEHLRPDGARTDSLKALYDRGFQIRRDYDRLLDRFEREHPAYYELKHQVETTSLPALQHVLSSDEALVTYITTADSLFLLTATREEADATALPIDSSFSHQVRSFRASIVEGDYDRFTDLGHSLYRTLVEIADSRLDAPRWVVIPDGVLHTIPFETLLTAPPPSAETVLRDYRTLPYLLRERTISYAYSATLLQQQRSPRLTPENGRPVLPVAARPQPGNAEPSATADFIAFAPVFFGGVTMERIPSGLGVGTSTAPGRPAVEHMQAGVGALPGTRSEVQSIARRFQSSYSWWDRLVGDRTQVYTDASAREARFRRDAGRYRFVHLATHGVVREDDPSLSQLLLAPGDSSSTHDDGVLHLNEIYNLELNAEMVVLSACETGIGRLATGEGVISLARGFVYAGARNVVVSLWPAADAPTRDLMVRFYDEILNGTPRADALRQAKLDALGDAESAAPSVWAPFVLIGQ